MSASVGNDSANLNTSRSSSGVPPATSLDPEEQYPEEVTNADDDDWMTDPYKASRNSEFQRYNLTVDREAGDRATEIKMFSLQRPHMRALHCAWISFFLAFTIWFAPAPLLGEIQKTLHLTKSELWTSSITNDITAIILRVLIGPICDKHAARIPMAVVLILASIPTACLGLVESAAGLATVRFFIGIAGSSFVMAQFWPSRMFSREIAGTANGLVGGWGNLGGAFTQVFMGAILFPTFRDYYNGDAEKSWRIICIIPASVAFLWGCILPFICDDAPMGNYKEMRKKGTMEQIFYTTSLRQSAVLNTWILFAQYACSFGVELVSGCVVCVSVHLVFSRCVCGVSLFLDAIYSLILFFYYRS
jgi:NNP family nitrate/nitrite transporter-like MFS transporter